MPRLAGWEVGRIPGFYNGAGVPSVATLEAGDYLVNDYYINTSANTLYRCSTAGNATTSVWTLLGAGSIGTAITVWAQIATHDTVGAAETSFTWSGLNGDTDGSYMIVGRWLAPAPAADDVLVVQPNADATAANYNIERLNGANAVASASRNVGTGIAGFELAEVTDNNDVAGFSSYLYAKTGLNRVMVAAGGDAMSTTFLFETQVSTWLNTASNIISMKVTTLFATTDIGIGSHFELWTPRTIHVTSVP